MKALFLLFGIIIFFGIAKLLAKGRKEAERKDLEFEKLYNEVQSEVQSPGRMFSPETIKPKLKRLENMKWNREKTDVLARQFLRKYYSVGSKPEMINESVR